MNRVRQRTGEPRTILDSWSFIVCGLLIACAILLLRAWGWIV